MPLSSLYLKFRFQHEFGLPPEKIFRPEQVVTLNGFLRLVVVSNLPRANAIFLSTP
jgi:hypothetical protein